MTGISSIGGAVGPLVGGAINMIEQNKANKINQANFEKSLKFNREEAQKNREAQSIINQARQMKASGINPASGNTLGLSQGGGSASASGLPNISPVTGFGEALTSASITQAQIANMNADTEKKKAEARNTDKNTDWIDRINNNQIELNKSVICLNEEQKKQIETLTPEQRKQISATIDNINKDTEQMSENIKVLATQARLNIKNEAFIDKKAQEIASQITLNLANARKANAERAYTEEETKRLRHTFTEFIKQTRLFTQTATTELMQLGLQLGFDQDTYQFRFDNARYGTNIMRNESTASNEKPQQATVQTDLLEREGGWRDCQNFWQGFSTIAGAMNGAIQSGTGMMNANTYSNWNTWQHGKARAEYMQHYGPSGSSIP